MNLYRLQRIWWDINWENLRQHENRISINSRRISRFLWKVDSFIRDSRSFSHLILSRKPDYHLNTMDRLSDSRDNILQR